MRLILLLLASSALGIAQLQGLVDIHVHSDPDSVPRGVVQGNRHAVGNEYAERDVRLVGDERVGIGERVKKPTITDQIRCSTESSSG